MWKRWKSGWQKTCGKSKIHQNLSINNIDNRQINAIIESTKENIQVEVCSKCHPFYTGKQSTASKKGQVEKFNKKFGFSTEK